MRRKQLMFRVYKHINRAFKRNILSVRLFYNNKMVILVCIVCLLLLFLK